MKTVAFIPIKLNNERFPGKNTLSLSDGVPLITRICNKALQVGDIEKTYVFCSSPEVQKYLPEGVKWLQRDKSLDGGNALISDVNAAFIKRIPSNIYVSLRATSPFVATSTIAACTRAVQSGEYDSAFPVVQLNTFLWIEGKPNYDLSKIPRTQDLPLTFAETTGFYAFTREYALKNERSFKMPYMHVVDKIEALDVDYPVDFEICMAVHKEILSKR
jgi:CMP-N-acetylneuraminic acid synthetase